MADVKFSSEPFCCSEKIVAIWLKYETNDYNQSSKVTPYTPGYSRLWLGQHPPDERSGTSLHERVRRFVVDRSKTGNMAYEFVQQGRFDQIGFLGNEGLLGQHDVFGGSGIGGKQTPVNVTPVPQVRIVAVLQQWISMFCILYMMNCEIAYPFVHLTIQSSIN